MKVKDTLKVLFRVDGGRIWGVSLGHLFRCMALARELRTRYRVDITFMMKNYEDGIEVVQGNGFKVWSIDREISHDQELDRIEHSGSDMVVFDLIDIAGKNVARLLERGIWTVIIDDTGNKKIEADVVINGSIVKKFHRYPKANRGTKYYLGSKYCILGEEFDNLPMREVKAEADSIMVSMGGSDPTGLTLKVIKVLAKLPIPATIKVILGPAFQDEEKVKQAVRGTANDFVIHRNVPSMAQMMLQSDIGITAGGMMAYELAATGTPGIIVPSNDIEVLTASAFRQQGTALNLESLERLGSEFEGQLMERLEVLIADAKQRAKMSQRGQQLVDGQGRARVVKVLGDMSKLEQNGLYQRKLPLKNSSLTA